MARKKLPVKTDWILTPTVKTRCPNYSAHCVWLLSSDDSDENLPMFYICYDCREVRRVGHGLVETQLR